LNCLTRPEFGIIQKTNKIIWVTQRPDRDLDLIKDYPGHEVKYEFYCLHPDHFTEEEADEFEEHWRGDLNKKKQPTIAEQMAWKLSAIYEDLKGRNKTEFANILMLQDLGAHMRKKEFKIVVENLFDMRHQDAAYTYLWYVTTFL
jgi:hypothetical protein